MKKRKEVKPRSWFLKNNIQIKDSEDIEYPFIVAYVQGEYITLKNGLLNENQETIILEFDSITEFNDFLDVYFVEGFNYGELDLIRLSDILPSIDIEVYNNLKNVNIKDLILEYIKS